MCFFFGKHGQHGHCFFSCFFLQKNIFLKEIFFQNVFFEKKFF